MPTASPVNVVVLNSSTVVDSAEFELIVAALAEHAQAFNECPWVTDGYVDPVGSVVAYRAGETLPANAYALEILDTSDQEGALGYHEDSVFQQGTPGTQPEKASQRSSRGLATHPETGVTIPVGKAFAKTSQEDGVSTCEVLDHEFLEMLGDPNVMSETQIRKYLDTATKQWFIGELCDPVQSTGPKATNGQQLANYVLPAYFGQHQSIDPTRYDAEGVLTAPFTVHPGGYMSVAPEDEPTNWSQIQG